MENECVRAEKARQGSPLLTTKQAAYYLGISTRTLQKMRTDGRGPRYCKHGSYVRYRIDDLEAWLKEKPCQSAPEQRGR